MSEDLPSVSSDDPLLREQIEYYRRRAPEYDDWFFQRGRYDEGERRRREWRAENARAHAILRSLGPVDAALELAGGTGIWSERLLQQARRLTLVDASPEALELALRRVRHDPRVSVEVADLVAYRPAQRYDLVAFTFWLSHVPPARLPGFFALLRRSLRPNGVLFAIDQRPARGKQTAADHLQERSLADGRSFRIVKLYYCMRELESLFAEHGFEVQVTLTPTLWIAVARRHGGGRSATLGLR